MATTLALDVTEWTDAERVAHFLAADPPPHAQMQAIDDLIGVFGNDRGLLIFARGVAIAAGTGEDAA